MTKPLPVAVATTALALLGAGMPAHALPAYTTADTAYVNPNLTRQVRVVGLRVGQHKNFDRIVIDVRGRKPSFTLGYVDELRYDGSGKLVPLAGRRKLQLRIEPGRAHTLAGRNLYTGPRLQQYRWATLRGVAFTGDYEGVVSFGFTARNREGYRVFHLTDPTRLVIDLKHP